MTAKKRTIGTNNFDSANQPKQPLDGATEKLPVPRTQAANGLSEGNLGKPSAFKKSSLNPDVKYNSGFLAGKVIV